MKVLGWHVCFGRHLDSVPDRSIVFFPVYPTTLCCGIAALVSIKKPRRTETPPSLDMAGLEAAAQITAAQGYRACLSQDLGLDGHYLGGDDHLDNLWHAVRAMKQDDLFYEAYNRREDRPRLHELSRRLDAVVRTEEISLAERLGRLDSHTVEMMAARLERLKDIVWCLSSEIIKNLEKIDNLLAVSADDPNRDVLTVFKRLNAILNAIERLEVRGRDSAGISLLFVLDEPAYKTFLALVERAKLTNELSERMSREVLTHGDICVHTLTGEDHTPRIAVACTYKVAAEIGRLGDNTGFLREQIKKDAILHHLTGVPHLYHTVSAHTRWASIGAITEPNCHPVDNTLTGAGYQKSGIIHVSLNGDIDNYLELKAGLEKAGQTIPETITTDTKIIPVLVEHYIDEGCPVEEAFRRAVGDFDGSHAISMHTDLAPGRLFLAQKGSGQAVFIGLAPEHYMAVSEVYGFVEETADYLKMDGEAILEGPNGKTQGQIFILDQTTGGGVQGIQAMYYDGTPIDLTEQDVKQTEITSRDIDRQNFPHYFLKEISESPLSVERTMLNRWKIGEKGENHYTISLDETVVPAPLRQALQENRIKRVFFVGQGTAGVAAAACANLLTYYLDDPSAQVSALKASELSGFKIGEHDSAHSMGDTLVIAISQSGTTTDTNRTVDMVKERGAYTLAIVNRRDSDITFKVDGVMYTSSGRDIEMSVASTKAFYSQIVAGAFLGLYIANLKQNRDDLFVAEEVKQLLDIPDHMRSVLSQSDAIRRSAFNTAVKKTYWATVGSGPNKVAADEIRIKLSELCYKTISSDFVEDKKHIDLSAEPLIIVCAAGTRGSVLGDIIKDTAIFKAHKATPIVIVDEGDNRFDLYAEDVFHVPAINEHLAPILNTLVGHIWGYHAAMAINEGSRFMFGFQEEVKAAIDEAAGMGLNVYEIVLDRSFKEKILNFYNAFRRAKKEKRLPGIFGIDISADLTLLLKYLMGRLPVSDFELDFNVTGTAVNMLEKLFESLGEAINIMARPVDAIKHQAKTVTVGTSRLQEKVEGLLFETLEAHGLNLGRLINRNVVVLKNLQTVVAEIKGAILYKISNLTALGEVTEETRIEIVAKTGVLKPIPSRVETDGRLTGTKRIIVKEGNVYVGKGRKDDRSILIIPLISASSATPNTIDNLLLLNIAFRANVPLPDKIRALGGKFDRIRNIVEESSVVWEDRFVELVAIDDLFGRSAEKISEAIVASINGK